MDSLRDARFAVSSGTAYKRIVPRLLEQLPGLNDLLRHHQIIESDAEVTRRDASVYALSANGTIYSVGTTGAGPASQVSKSYVRQRAPPGGQWRLW